MTAAGALLTLPLQIEGIDQVGGVELLLAAAPLLVVAGLLVGLLWPATRAMPVAWAVAILVGLVLWGAPIDFLVAASLDGVITALTILWIVFGALVLLYTMMQAGALDRINQGFAAVSRDRRVQIVLVGFFLATFIEGAAGFGTPAAVVAPLLLGLGFPALAAVIAAIIGHIIAVTYGAVGTPIIVGIQAPMERYGTREGVAEGIPVLAEAGFTPVSYSQEVAAWAATYHALVGFLMPLIAVAMVVYFFGEDRTIRPAFAVAPLCLFAGISFAVPYWVSAWFITAEFPALIGSMVGGFLTISVLRAGYLLPEEEWDFPDRDQWEPHWVGDIEPGGEGMSGSGSDGMSLGKAWAPYVILALLLVVTRASDAIGSVIGNTDRSLVIETGVGDFALGVGIGWSGILGYDLGGFIDWINVPGFWLILSALIAIPLFGMSGTQVRAAWREAGEKIVSPFIALVFVIAMVSVMLNVGAPDLNHDITGSMIEVLAVAVASTLGSLYPFFTSLIGALGAAMTGSNTVSNITFSGFQYVAASQLGVPTQIVVGAQAVGGAIGNLVAIHNIVAALATVGLLGQEGRVIRLNLIPLAYYAGFVGIWTMLFAFVVFPGIF
jgi:lactate permease